MRLIGWMLLGTATVLMCQSFGWACLNDSELPQHEREFRSRYQLQQLTQLESPVDGEQLSPLWISRAGWLLGLSAVALSWYSTRQRT